MAEAIPQLFGLIPTSHPPILAPSAAPSPTSFIYTIPLSPARPFNHIVVFLLPGIALPPNTAAAVYISLPNAAAAAAAPPTFKFLGGIGPGKESAIYKISGLTEGNSTGNTAGAGGEIDMDAPDSGTTGGLTIGISVESAESVAAQMAVLSSPNTAPGPGGQSNALVLANKPPPPPKPDTLLLAQRIIKNAFNFLASFSGNVAGGVEVVPLKAFEEWWKKFEGRVRSDPGFLERDVVD